MAAASADRHRSDAEHDPRCHLPYIPQILLKHADILDDISNWLRFAIHPKLFLKQFGADTFPGVDVEAVFLGPLFALGCIPDAVRR